MRSPKNEPGRKADEAPGKQWMVTTGSYNFKLTIQDTYGDGKEGETRGKTVDVGSLPANAWGLHEMHGNVSEWCHDWHAEYVGGPETDPKGPEKVVREHIIRGGAWRSYPGACRSACRLRQGASGRFPYIGFRAVCALPAKPEEALLQTK